MKKILLSTALISASAGMAAAEITFSGSGRFGLDYVEGRAVETQLNFRFRTEINGKVETDSGVTFGGRVRLQYTQGTSNDTDRNSVTTITTTTSRVGNVTDVTETTTNTTNTRNGATLSAAYVYATYEGFRVEVGNANGALDSTKLIYNSEIGFQAFGAGDPIGVNASFSSSPYTNTPNRVGVFASYSVGDLNLRASYHTMDQTVTNADSIASVSADYVFGAVTISGGFESFRTTAVNGDIETFALAAEYGNDNFAVGLLYFDVNNEGAVVDQNKVTLYGNYTFDAVTVRAYVSGGDNLGVEDTAYGIGVDYDLGGATLAAGIEQGFNGNTRADAGVRFSF